MRFEDLKINAEDVRQVTENDIEWAKIEIGTSNGGYTLCDTIRQIYEISGTVDNVAKVEIQRRCLIIFCYAKRMNAKLMKYARERGDNG
jgi:hypothetical protein